MLKFYVVSAGRDIVNDTERSTTRRSRSRAPPLQRKIQKMEVLPKTWVSPNKRLILSQINSKLSRLAIENKTRNRKTSKATTEDGSCNQELIN